MLVTGATGFIGQHLVNRLLEEGENVCVITRNLDKVPSKWKDRLSILKGDLSDRDFSLSRYNRKLWIEDLTPARK